MASGWRWRLALLALFGVAAGARAWLALSEPFLSYDSRIYFTVAENLARHGCVSLSPPESGDCRPDWGGNQLPGFPAFIAVAHLACRIAGAAPEPWVPDALTPPRRLALLVQVLLFGALVVYLAVCAARLLRSRGGGLGVGALVALSPVTLPWSRFLLTESIAAAVTLWIAAELVRSLAERRLRVVPLACAHAAAIFLRYDGLVLLLPTLILALALHPPRAALLRTGVLALLVALPLGAWWLRSVAAGLPALPPHYAPYGWERSAGAWEFMRTWMTTELESVHFWWPLIGGRYADIRVMREPFEADEFRELQAALRQLVGVEAGPLPPPVDAALRRLAEERRRRAWLRTRVGVPALRAWSMWSNPEPYFEAGWLGMRGLPPPVTRAYRLALGAAALGVLGAALWRRQRDAALLALCAVSGVVVRTALLAWLGFVETRYLVPAAPLLEALVPTAALLLARPGRGPEGLTAARPSSSSRSPRPGSPRAAPR